MSLMAEDRSMMISREAERGCPQGSIVGPYAWRWCMDELLNDARCEWSSDTVEWVAYADDIVIAVKGNNRLDLERLSKRCLSHLMSWCGRYELRLSTPKTKYMLIKGHMDKSRMPGILCARKRIECVRQYKYLGVILDSVPNFVMHANWVRAKVSAYMFSLKAHVGRGWGIQRRVVDTLYDTVCIPMIAYDREEWAKSMIRSQVKKHLNALHRLLILTLTRSCTPALTVSLEGVAGRMPLDLAVCLRRIRQSIKAKRAIELLGFASDAEAPVADEMGRANEHVVSLWQERWDAEKRGRMPYRFIPSVNFASMNRWFRPGFLTAFILTGYGRVRKAAFDRAFSPTDRCLCCFCQPETVEHLIFDFLNYVQFRPTFFDECRHEWSMLINCETRFSQPSVSIKLAFEERELSL